MEFIYNAKRSVKAGRVIGDQYTITMDVDVDNYSTSIKGKQVESLSGNTVTIIHNDEEFIDIKTSIVNTATTPNKTDMREFLNSVKAGEIFTVDGVNAVLTSITNPYSESLLGNTDYYSYSFKVKIF